MSAAALCRPLVRLATARAIGAGPVPITATVTLTAAVVATTAATTILLGGGRVGLQLKRAGPSGQRQGDEASCTATEQDCAQRGAGDHGQRVPDKFASA